MSFGVLVLVSPNFIAMLQPRSVAEVKPKVLDTLAPARPIVEARQRVVFSRQVSL
jgi:hypothetical protein